MIHTRNTQSGYMLVEAIIYLALFVMLSSLLVYSIVVMSRAYTETRVNRDLLDSIQVSVERMSREIRGATSVNVGSSTFGVNPGTLTINTTDVTGATTYETFSLATSTMAIDFNNNGLDEGSLTSNQVSVDSLVFRYMSPAHGNAVKIEMTLHSLRYPNARSVSLSDTIQVRGTYH